MHKLTERMLKSIVKLYHLYYLAYLFVGCCHGMFWHVDLAALHRPLWQRPQLHPLQPNFYAYALIVKESICYCMRQVAI